MNFSRCDGVVYLRPLLVSHTVLRWLDFMIYNYYPLVVYKSQLLIDSV